MKLLKCTSGQMTLTLVELPRTSYRVLGPRKWQVIATVAVIVISAVVWSLL